MFANSPFTEGRPNGFLSFRSEIWRDTDPDRTGMLPWAFEAGMGFERYVDYALDVPMYFVKRGERVSSTLPGNRSARPDAGPTSGNAGRARNALGLVESYLDDLSGGPSQALSGNAGSGRRAVAAASCAAGLLGRESFDDDVALDAAWDLVKGWTAEQRQLLRDQVPKLGFAAEIAGRKVVDLARITIALAQQGLARRQRLDSAGDDESRYLEPIQYYVERGITPAEISEQIRGRVETEPRAGVRGIRLLSAAVWSYVILPIALAIAPTPARAQVGFDRAWRRLYQLSHALWRSGAMRRPLRARCALSRLGLFLSGNGKRKRPVLA